MMNSIKNKIKNKIKKIPIVQKKLYVSKENQTKKIIYLRKNKSSQIFDLLSKVEISLARENRYQHWLDENIYCVNFYSVLGNMPPNYSLILKNSLIDLKEKYYKLDGKVAQQNFNLLDAVENYIKRIIVALKSENENGEYDNAIRLYSNMLNVESQTIDDALQRILLWSSIFWQTGHKLVGLGRLDLILEKYYDESIPEEEYIVRFVDFFNCIHDYYEFKSSQLKGDTGQIVIVGGVDNEGKCFSNKLTTIIIKAIKKLNKPDPKVLLRVCKETSDEVWREALMCIETGVGSPLLSNDEVVIPALCEFGYNLTDARNYATSACWEPLCYGNSLEQNNLININFAQTLSDTLKDKAILNVKNLSELMDLYYKHLEEHLCQLLQAILTLRWENDPLYTLFTDNCIECDLDISEGGAKYNNYGILSVGLANTVDSIINLEKHVFGDGKYTLEHICDVWNDDNYDAKYNLQVELKELDKSYGHDEKNAIEITQKIMNHVSWYINEFRNHLGGKVKFGLSSPAYWMKGKDTDMTFDGRMKGDPLNVHISSNDNIAYTELIGFASELCYEGNRANGNVVDFMITPSFIDMNFEKMLEFLKLSVHRGFFQIQMNVLCSEQLIEAKKNPAKYKNLIVRVWGFSAYFNDLPEEYKDILIHRALLSEGKK